MGLLAFSIASLTTSSTAAAISDGGVRPGAGAGVAAAGSAGTGAWGGNGDASTDVPAITAVGAAARVYSGDTVADDRGAVDELRGLEGRLETGAGFCCCFDGFAFRRAAIAYG